VTCPPSWKMFSNAHLQVTEQVFSKEKLE